MFFFASEVFNEVYKIFGLLFAVESNEAEDETEVSVLAQEVNESKKEFNKKYGWVKLTKDVSDYTNTSLFILFKNPAIEVLTIAQMMIEESEMNQVQSNLTEGNN